MNRPVVVCLVLAWCAIAPAARAQGPQTFAVYEPYSPPPPPDPIATPEAPRSGRLILSLRMGQMGNIKVKSDKWKTEEEEGQFITGASLAYHHYLSPYISIGAGAAQVAWDSDWSEKLGFKRFHYDISAIIRVAIPVEKRRPIGRVVFTASGGPSWASIGDAKHRGYKETIDGGTGWHAGVAAGYERVWSRWGYLGEVGWYHHATPQTVRATPSLPGAATSVEKLDYTDQAVMVSIGLVFAI